MKNTCLVCQIGSYVLDDLAQPPSVKGVNCFEFHIGKKCQFVVLRVIAGLLQKPTEASELL